MKPQSWLLVGSALEAAVGMKVPIVVAYIFVSCQRRFFVMEIGTTKGGKASLLFAAKTRLFNSTK